MIQRMGRYRTVVGILSAMTSMSACRRASEEIERLDPNTPLPDVVDRGDNRLVERDLPSIGLPAPTVGPIGTAHPTTLIQAAKNARSQSRGVNAIRPRGWLVVADLIVCSEG